MQQIWTALEHDGPNHLACAGVRKSEAIGADMVPLITSGSWYNSVRRAIGRRRSKYRLSSTTMALITSGSCYDRRRCSIDGMPEFQVDLLQVARPPHNIRTHTHMNKRTHMNTRTQHTHTHTTHAEHRQNTQRSHFGQARRTTHTPTRHFGPLPSLSTP